MLFVICGGSYFGCFSVQSIFDISKCIPETFAGAGISYGFTYSNRITDLFISLLQIEPCLLLGTMTIH